MAPAHGDSRDLTSNANHQFDSLPPFGGSDPFPRHDIKHKKSSISEMKRINALNLEPTLPKPNDGADRRQMASRDALGQRGAAGRSDLLKQEFKSSLDHIVKQSAAKAKKGAINASEGDSSQSKSKALQYNQPLKGASGGMLNPNAADFTPIATTAPTGAASGPAPASKAAGPAPQFAIKKDPESNRTLDKIFEPFFLAAKDSMPSSSLPNWPDAKGPTYREYLGKPDPGQSIPINMAGSAPPGGGGSVATGPAPSGAWSQQSHQQHQMQQQQPQQQQSQQQGPPGSDQNQMGPMGGNAPPMMQQGFVMANQSGQPGMQMYPYMPQGMQGMAVAAQPGPQGPQGGMSQQGQSQGGMSQQQQQSQQASQGGQSQQQMVFPQQMMMAAGGVPGQPGSGQAMVPVGMVAPSQGQNPGGGMNMGPMLNFPGGQPGQMMMVPMMVPSSGFMPQQNFVPQQGMQGQPGQMLQQAMYHPPNAQT